MSDVNLFLKHRGESLRRPVVNELVGGPAGYHVEHWDDSVDARVIAPKTELLVPKDGLFIPGYGLFVPYEIAYVKDGKPVPAVMGGAFGNSGLYALNWIDILDATQLAIDTSLTTHKWALYTNTLTPSFTADSAYSSTNEVTGTGYTAGGQTIVSPTTTDAGSGLLTYDMADQVWAAPTTVTARGAILYADALAGNNLIVAMTFGSDFASTAGTYTIQFAAGGVFTIDLTP